MTFDACERRSRSDRCAVPSALKGAATGPSAGVPRYMRGAVERRVPLWARTSAALFSRSETRRWAHLDCSGRGAEWTVSRISALSIRFEIGVIRGCSVVEIAPSSRHRLLHAEDGVKDHGGHLTWPRAASQL